MIRISIPASSETSGVRPRVRFILFARGRMSSITLTRAACPVRCDGTHKQRSSGAFCHLAYIQHAPPAVRWPFGTYRGDRKMTILKGTLALATMAFAVQAAAQITLYEH